MVVQHQVTAWASDPSRVSHILDYRMQSDFHGNYPPWWKSPRASVTCWYL